MKSYTITVNGKAYDVTVEEKNGQAAPAAYTAPAAAPVQPAAPIPPAAAAPAPAPAPAPAAAPAPAQAAGGVAITAPMPGKILGIKAPAGTAVTAGQVVLILEAMKMENEIVAPQDGTIASINVNTGDMVEAGDTLATMN